MIMTGEAGMPFCSNCGHPLEKSTKFCTSCGASGGIITDVPAPLPAPLRVAESKRGGRLAGKGFLIGFALAVIVAMATKGHEIAVSLGMAFAFAIGAAYIVFNLRKWTKNKETIRGANIGWAVAGFLLLMFVGGLATVGSGNRGISKSGNTTSGSDVTATTIPAKHDEAKSVIGLCGKPTQDHPQELNAGACSEGRALVYRKYNTELWFYRGPASSQWM